MVDAMPGVVPEVKLARMHARRYETHAQPDTAKKDFSSAERYYYQAVDVFPEGVGPASVCCC
jgi:hypothetical protein